MAFAFFAFVIFLHLPFVRLASAQSNELHCEATPIEYDNSLSLFCQEDDLSRNISSSKNATVLPDLSASLKKVLFTDDHDEYEPSESSRVRNETYGPVDPKNVTDLSVWAKFTEIPDGAFSNFSNLRQLHVAQFYDDTSGVVTIKDQAFSGLTKLELLGLHLKFSRAPIPKAVSQLDSIVSLGLYESELASDFAVGKSWPRLRLLTIYDSPNMSLAENAFDGVLDTLNEIDLSNVRIGKFPKAISDLRNLTRIEVAATALQEVPPDAFSKSASSLTVIRMSRNRISVLDPASFRGLHNLKVLQLAYNEIETIPAGIFDDLTALEVLNLAGNKIKSLPASIFDHNKNLHILDLDENPINASASDYLKGHPSENGTDYGGESENEYSSSRHPFAHNQSTPSKGAVTSKVSSSTQGAGNSATGTNATDSKGTATTGAVTGGGSQLTKTGSKVEQGTATTGATTSLNSGRASNGTTTSISGGTRSGATMSLSSGGTRNGTAMSLSSGGTGSGTTTSISSGGTRSGTTTSISSGGTRNGTTMSLSSGGTRNGTTMSLSSSGTGSGTTMSLSSGGTRSGTNMSISSGGTGNGTTMSLSSGGTRSGTNMSISSGGTRSGTTMSLGSGGTGTGTTTSISSGGTTPKPKGGSSAGATSNITKPVDASKSVTTPKGTGSTTSAHGGSASRNGSDSHVSESVTASPSPSIGNRTKPEPGHNETGSISEHEPSGTRPNASYVIGESPKSKGSRTGLGFARIAAMLIGLRLIFA